MTRRAEALAFSRRVIPRTGKTKTVIPPHKSGERRDIFNVFHYFYSLWIQYAECPQAAHT